MSDTTHTYEYNRSIQVVPQMDKLPMQTLYLNYSIKPKEKSIELTLVTAGGAPYTCSVNYGDLSSIDNSIKSAKRMNKFKLSYFYSAYGVYNLTATCQCANAERSALTQWITVYLPNPSLASQIQVYVDKSALTGESLVSLDLPFNKLAGNVRYQIVDASALSVVDEKSGGNLIFDGINSAETSRVVFKFKNLKSSYNLISLQLSNSFVLASYMVIVEDGAPTKPKISVAAGQDLKFNLPVFFDVEIKKIGIFFSI